MMNVQLAKCCANCEHFINGQICTKQEITVSENQVCESYTFKPVIHHDDDCLKCSKFNTGNCAHTKKASEGIMCTVWYPRMAHA